ncbi:MAG TPA: ABC transporter ATP-binding protein [Dehalococcoidia bacterium]|nr:ABC transporter ATP-binding protein [Dehalococcoidia bacterium]
MSEPVLQVDNLHCHFATKEGPVKAVNGVTLTLEQGKVMAVVGESGCGKTTLALAILRLLPFPGQITDGSIQFEGQNVLGMSEADLRRLRGRSISMIFQDPVSGLNPVLPVGKQVEEILASHLDIPKREQRARAVDLLRQVGLPEPERIATQYPFHLSGGMCQRVMIAMATALNPKVVIADEPTSALDVTVQAQILTELENLRRQRGTSILLITHDLGVVAQMADEVAIMYAGSVVETGTVASVFRSPRHPYTWALLSTLPRIDSERSHLRAIPGSPPSLLNLGEECPFLPRCSKAMTRCRQEPAPALVEVDAGQWAACYNPIFQGWQATD